MRKNTISEAELEIMDVVWNSVESLSAYEIRQRLNKKKKWGRTTVLTFIRRLVEKGFLAQEKREVYYYSSLVGKQEYNKEETKHFVNRIYQGSPKELITALVEENNLSKEDITELREYFKSL